MTQSDSAWADAMYEELLAEAMSEQPDIDYAQLRAAFTRTDAYDPYGSTLADLIAQAREATARGDHEAAVTSAAALVAAAFPCLESQFWASETYAAAGDPARAAHHADIFFRLYKGAMAAGDGSSMDRAITVLSVGEEYLILSAVRRLDVEGQHLEEAGGHSYDCMDVRDPETGAATQVYFNIDSLLAVLHRKEMT